MCAVETEARLMPFTKEDWFGYAGACQLPDGREPLIAHVDACTVILAGWEIGSRQASVYVEKSDDDSVRHATRTFAALAPAEKYANFLLANPEMIEALETLVDG